jgi:peptidylprolyl isomerase
VSNRVKERHWAAARAAGLPSKAERRALGKQAAAKRAAARRRRRLLRNAGAVAVAAAVVAVIAVAFGAFRSSPSSTANPQASGSAAPTASAAGDAGAAVPAGLDAALKTKPVVTKGTGTVSKLKVTTIVQGTGAPITAGQTLTVNYVGVTYATGEEFDSSWKRGTPLDPFPIGQGKVIKGWDEGLIGVKVGSRVQLDIPADLAYGEKTTDGSPSGALRFVVDVLSAA